MTAKILDGKAIAQELRESIRAEVDAQVAKGQIRQAWPLFWWGKTLLPRCM